ncbi:hypothetical protein NEMBOFW57_006311 [Staphylotrichum longicolle]|uniref:F-box domain-containing protein n=1 Tax=Staphylotrichum longicolle TaxID=669026 RepID=A0AAD4EYN8_9PEZI|nr:hypothetical protein NEMBOFW57_006311 [Staphylotrichum longicolle]
MDFTQPVTVDALPPELLRQIFSDLDGPAPSEIRLHDQPVGDMLRDSQCVLKNISLVSRRWRVIVMPLLFRHVVWALEHCDQLLAKPSGHGHPADQVAVLAFLRANDLARHVQSFTVIVCGGMTPVIPPMPASTAPSPTASVISYSEDNDWLWDMLFSVMDPLRLTLITSPQNLARLLGCSIFVGDADFFATGERLHILSLARDDRSLNVPPRPSVSKNASQTTGNTSRCLPGNQAPAPHALVTIRPWTRLLLNENSSICVYRTYHYFHRRPPSILSHMLYGWEDTPGRAFMIPPTVASLSYVAIFPLVSQLRQLVQHLPRGVEHLYLQLVPRNNILLDKHEMYHVQPPDLWLERSDCYELVMRKLLSRPRSPAPVMPNADDSDGDDDDGEGHDGGDGEVEEDGMDSGPSSQAAPTEKGPRLRRFETGDSADAEVWQSMVRFAHENRTGWIVESKGTLVKGPLPPDESDGIDMDDVEIMEWLGVGLFA